MERMVLLLLLTSYKEGGNAMVDMAGWHYTYPYRFKCDARTRARN